MPVLCIVFQPYRARLYRDAALFFKLHVVQNLVFHDALFYCVAFFYQAVGQSGFAVIYMRDYRKIANVFLICHVCLRNGVVMYLLSDAVLMLLQLRLPGSCPSPLRRRLRTKREHPLQ